MKNVKQHIDKQLWYLLGNNLKYIVESDTITQLHNDVKEKIYHKIYDEISFKARMRIINYGKY
jgi:hypothetical protein